jgi:Peptidase S46
MARSLVRAAAERKKPDTDRLPEYTDARRATFERMLLSSAPIYLAAEEVKLAAGFEWLVQAMGADHELVKTVLDGKSPADRARELMGATMLAKIETRKALLEGGDSAVKASSDPMIQLALAVDGEARALRARYENEVVSVERDAYARIARALFAVKGTSAYPDATSTLRLSYGAVKGYTEDGKPVAPFTNFAGLYEHAQARGGKAPWALPSRWIERKATLDLSVPFNFVTTNDIVGGNSGSPVVNARGQLVGIAFDGNIQSLPAYFVYDGTMNRTVAVDSRGILEALTKMYDAQPLVDELLGKVPATAETAASLR